MIAWDRQALTSGRKIPGIPGLPVGILRAAAPLVQVPLQVAAWGEKQWFTYLGSRIASARGPSTVELGGGTPTDRSLSGRLNALVEESVAQSVAAGREALFVRVLDQIVPDEARILAALSNGSTYPVVHVFSRATSGGDAYLENMSLVGRAANLALPGMTPTYVANLLRLGLAELGNEDPSLAVEFEILEADPAVLAAVKAAARGPLPARTERQTLRISTFGADLWNAAFTQDD